MASRIETPVFTIPAGTADTAPVSASLFDRDADVVSIEFLFPPGPSGLVGIAVWHSNEQIIPATRGDWIIADDETIRWPLSGYPSTPSWQIVGYNDDVHDHSIYLRILLDELPVRALVPMLPLVILPPNAAASEPFSDIEL